MRGHLGDATTDNIAGEAQQIRTRVSRALAGDAYAIEELNETLPASIAYRDECRELGYNTGMLDVAIGEAERVIGGGTTSVAPSTGMFLPQGLRIGNVIVPWIAVLALTVLVVAALRSKRSAAAV